MRIAVKPLDDTQALAELHRAPEFAVVNHDHRIVEPIDHPLASYLGAYVGDRLAGCFLLIRFSSLETEIHALIRRPFVAHGRDLLRACVTYVFQSAPVARITGYVIEGLESARNFALKVGFKQEGFRRDACSRGGRLVGVHVMGLTRSDWEAA